MTGCIDLEYAASQNSIVKATKEEHSLSSGVAMRLDEISRMDMPSHNAQRLMTFNAATSITPIGGVNPLE
ncbi:hypothetical protein [Rhodoferax sp.]|uniref:hypothetical protein n=1 Tax=Rhodoferax sp. TaxID=50421 RepID=UPI002ACE70FE|nr:hypothetical protein [Rhodoferax sp.]MDZ7920247.1 hypothetical protein [Rhodoferax sp.]